jgi:hypothetical protein
MNRIRAVCLLGGVYHEFDQAETYFGDLLPQIDVHPQFTRDPAALGNVRGSDVDLVFIYSCIEGELSESAAANLVSFVEAGGGLFAMHGATASFPNNETYLTLIGAKFIEHGPRHNFLVMPMERPHPVTANIEAFTVNDELYVQEYAADLQIHMAAVYFNKIQPIVWTRTPGAGRVCYVALGHDLAVWQQPPVRQLVANGVLWSGKHLG